MKSEYHEFSCCKQSMTVKGICQWPTIIGLPKVMTCLQCEKCGKFIFQKIAIERDDNF